MTHEVYESLQTIIRNRPELAKEPEVDGYSGFLLDVEKWLKIKAFEGI